jgi:hypothetical protein
VPRRERKAQTTRSEHWLRVAVNEHSARLDASISNLFGWGARDTIKWLSPIASDEYAEYFDEEFLTRLGLTDLKVPLKEFWPRSGPRWDGLAKTKTGKLILVEAKAHIAEAVTFHSKAEPGTLRQISRALQATKDGFKANQAAPWETPFYQYTNRLAHLYFLRQLNAIDAYLVFLYFSDAPDVPTPPPSEREWKGAIELTEKCLGLGEHPFKKFVGSLIWSVPEMLAK